VNLLTKSEKTLKESQ